VGRQAGRGAGRKRFVQRGVRRDEEVDQVAVDLPPVLRIGQLLTASLSLAPGENRGALVAAM
jgi:hypothetical protein